MPLSVCQTFTVCSKEILKWQNKQEAVNKESISDWFLYKLNDLNENIRSIQLNRIQEARMTGADFELWVVGHIITHRFRIQAKRLRRGKDHYYGIAYTNEHGIEGISGVIVVDLRSKNRKNKNKELVYMVGIY